MASNVSKTRLLQTLNKRRFASAAPKTLGYYGSELNVSNLPNSTIVASVPSALPISRLSVVVKAGSRYDPPDLPGLNHVLRASAGLSTTRSTKFGILRNLQEVGANISCTSSRDTITYTLEATCDQLSTGFKYLKDVVVNQAFKPWELEENADRIKYELSTVPPEARLVDLLHKAAYRTSLGNTLFVDEFNIGKINSESLQHQVATLFTSSRTAVVGVGVDHNTVSSFASELELPSGLGANVDAVYKGGDISVHGPAPLAYVGVAVEGSGFNDNDVLAFEVLRYALGGWSSVKWSAGSTPLAAVVRQFQSPTAISAFNAVHADSGLFGFVLATTTENAKPAALEAAKLLKSTKLNDKIVDGAKSRYIQSILDRSGDQIAHDFGAEALAKENPSSSLASLIDSISGVKTSDVTQALGQFASGKKTVASYGRIGTVPYSDEFQ